MRLLQIWTVGSGGGCPPDAGSKLMACRILNAVLTIEIAQLPGSEALEVGQQAYLSNQLWGSLFRVKVTAKNETTITLDANHEMAGKELNFHIELVEVK